MGRSGLIITFFLFHLQLGFSQGAEQLAVHFDKPFYVAGEDAWYKIYFQHPAAELKSKVLRVEWIGPDGELRLQQKLKIEENYALGDLAIPYDWEEGNYLVRIYTLWSLNFEDKAYFQQIIPIYNLFESPAIVERPEEKADNPVSAQGKTNDLVLDITADKDWYFRRDTVRLEIKLGNRMGDPVEGSLSIAVQDGNYLPDFVQADELTGQSLSAFNSEKFQPETGLYIQGNLYDKSDQPLNTRFLTVYFPYLKSFEQTTVSSGSVFLPIPGFEGKQAVQYFDMNPFHEPTPRIEMEDFMLEIPYQGKALIRSERAADYLFLLSKYRQYQEAFNLAAPDYGGRADISKPAWQPDKVWGMEKYTALSDLASFAAEIIAQGRVIRKGTQPSIRLQYAEKSIYNSLSPWYMVNGWLTEDENTVLKIPFREIEKVEMYNSKNSITKYLDPSMVSRGLLTISTASGKTPEELIKKPNNLELQGFYPQRKFPQNISEDESSPDLRPLIYWNPLVRIRPDGKGEVKFATSDGIGKCRIRIRASDKNGRLGESLLEYEVKLK